LYRCALLMQVFDALSASDGPFTGRWVVEASLQVRPLEGRLRPDRL